MWPITIGTGPGSSGWTYNWQPSGGVSNNTIAQPNVSLPWAAIGTTVNYVYTVTVTNSFGCTASDQITVAAYGGNYDLLSHNSLWGEAGINKSVNCPMDGVTIGTSGTIPNLTYQWYPATNPSNTQQTTANPPATTNYILYSTETTTGCMYSDNVLVTVTSVLGCRIANNETRQLIETSKGGLVIYPNPNNGIFSLDYSLTEGDVAMFQLFDMNGRMITSHSMPAGENVLWVDQSALPAGIFFYKIIVNSETVKSDKIVVIK